MLKKESPPPPFPVPQQATLHICVKSVYTLYVRQGPWGGGVGGISTTENLIRPSVSQNRAILNIIIC